MQAFDTLYCKNNTIQSRVTPCQNHYVTYYLATVLKKKFVKNPQGKFYENPGTFKLNKFAINKV